jgi:type I restriction enzyme, S subunit
MSSRAKTTPPLRGTPPEEGNDSPSVKGWQAKPDGVVPKLRFPEFRGAKAWKPISLLEASTPVTERVGEKKLTPVSISAGIGFVPQAEKFGRDISGNQYQLYTLVKDGDFVFNKGNSLKFPQGCIYLLQGWGQVAAPNVFICFRLKNGYSNNFFQNCFEQNQHGRQLKRHITSGARSNGLLNISKEIFFGVEIPTPSSAEQQKIAECLSSVDERIATQVRKVDALKTHKKGLMQQLFPREGETQPRFRFSEFKKTDAWKRKRIDEWGNVLAGKALAVNAPGPLRPYLRTKNVLDGAIDIADVLTMPMTESEFGRFEILGGDVLLNEGQSLGLVGRASIYRGELGQRCAMQNQLLRFRAYPSTCPEFAAQALRQCQKDGTFASIATQTTSVAHLGSSRFSALALTWPSSLAEQKRIASCLCNLDAVISAETQKLDTLKTHKKGLMQQLFPSPEDVEA